MIFGAIVVALLFSVMFSNGGGVYAVAKMTISDVRLFSDYEGTQEIDLSSPMAADQSFLTKITYKYEADRAIRAGDTVSVDFLDDRLDNGTHIWTVKDMAATDVVGEDGKKVFDWKIEDYKIVITFGEGAAGKGVVEGELITGRRLNVQTRIVVLGEQNFKMTVGDYEKKIGVISAKRTTTETKNDFLVTDADRTNDMVSWAFMTSSKPIKELYASGGEEALSDGVQYKNLIAESQLNEDIIGAEVTNISAYCYVPFRDNDGVMKASSNKLTLSIMSLAREVKQTDDQSYEEFKSSLGELEYGFYRDVETGRTTFVINYGDIPNQITYQQALNLNGITTSLGEHMRSNSEFLSQETANYVDRALGRGNAVQGRVVGIQVTVEEKYDVVHEIVGRPSTVKFSYQDNSGKAHSVTRASKSNRLIPLKAGWVRVADFVDKGDISSRTNNAGKVVNPKTSDENLAVAFVLFGGAVAGLGAIVATRRKF
ncbi:hypothetical protein IKF15_02735 [Candidatus Saccharibacteria bacterium]|nr:hypothetical protein [Candidatus Saccharibacteria bacterium]